MDRQTALALADYINRGFGIIPVTLAQAQALQGALSSIHAVANGLVTMTLTPVGTPAPTPPPKPPKK